MKHQISDLHQMQALPLDIKIRMTENRIRDWYNHYDGEVYCSFSGGKDSTVLLDIIRNTVGVYDVPAVFVDTGLEYPEIKAFVKSVGNVTIIRPNMTFRQVIEKYGYPVISKEVARCVQYAKKAIAEGREENHGDYKKLCGLAIDKSGNKSRYNCEKWRFLLNAPFNCSSVCCTVMKKNPMKQYEKESEKNQSWQLWLLKVVCEKKIGLLVVATLLIVNTQFPGQCLFGLNKMCLNTFIHIKFLMLMKCTEIFIQMTPENIIQQKHRELDAYFACLDVTLKKNQIVFSN